MLSSAPKASLELHITENMHAAGSGQETQQPQVKSDPESVDLTHQPAVICSRRLSFSQGRSGHQNNLTSKWRAMSMSGLMEYLKGERERDAACACNQLPCRI